MPRIHNPDLLGADVVRAFHAFGAKVAALRACAAPLPMRAGRSPHAALVVAAVAQEHDLAQPVRPQAGEEVGQQALVSVLGEAEGPGAPHVPGGRVDVALGLECHDRRDQGVAQLGAMASGVARRMTSCLPVAR
jgi:hypothetical protein